MTVAGSGPEREQLGELARALGVAMDVNFAGRLDNDRIGGLYQQADLFLNPSTVDNMPISVLEALASGVPVVSTNVGGIPFLVEHQKTALLVSPRDPEAMARAVIDLLDDPAKAARLASVGRESVQQYAWQNVRGRWFDIYSALVPSPSENAAAETK
jgi:glycosyltransferase involved in cell wall biosynthesis